MRRFSPCQVSTRNPVKTIIAQFWAKSIGPWSRHKCIRFGGTCRGDASLQKPIYSSGFGPDESHAWRNCQSGMRRPYSKRCACLQRSVCSQPSRNSHRNLYGTATPGQTAKGLVFLVGTPVLGCILRKQSRPTAPPDTPPRAGTSGTPPSSTSGSAATGPGPPARRCSRLYRSSGSCSAGGRTPRSRLLHS